MNGYIPALREISRDVRDLDRFATQNALWYETEDDRERRWAVHEFREEVMPSVRDLVDKRLTRRQKEVVHLYFFLGKTQEDIAAILDLSQSTVSRHLFGVVRGGKHIGGAVAKLRRAIEREPAPVITNALSSLRERLSA
jgi:RNA polymerase sigma factor (sigma-70 family)